MVGRTVFNYLVKAQLSNGGTADTTVSTFWSPGHDLTNDGVGEVARQRLEKKHKRECAVLSVEPA